MLAGGCRGAALRAAGVALFFALVAGLMADPGSADLFTFGNPAFCAPRKPVRDFGLSQLPPVQEVPESGKELGHGAVDIYGDGNRVMPGPESFGYGFTENDYSGTVLLNWTVTAQLWTVDRTGTAFEEVDHAELFIGRLSALHQPHIEVHPPATRRGFYRFDMQFTDQSGKALGSYSAYFKVVRPFWKVKLGLSRAEVPPGGRILSRLENFGSETVRYGEAFSVQRFEGGRWVGIPELLPKGWFAWLGALGPGGIGRCNVLSLPKDTPPGRYRMIKNVGRPPWSGGGKSVNLVAPFRVLGIAG